jgi:hypothetical protein
MGPCQCEKTTLTRAIAKITRSMLSALDDLKLDRLFLIYKGYREISLNEKISAIPASIL